MGLTLNLSQLSKWGSREKIEDWAQPCGTFPVTKQQQMNKSSIFFIFRQPGCPYKKGSTALRPQVALGLPLSLMFAFQKNVLLLN